MIDTKEMRQEGKEAGGLRCGELCVQAADEIERLRSAMQRAADMLPANAACGVLRSALKQ